jgi:hypothetical protein
MSETEDHLTVLKERRDWLAARIEAKQKVEWDTTWDERERRALEWAVKELEQ